MNHIYLLVSINLYPPMDCFRRQKLMSPYNLAVPKLLEKVPFKGLNLSESFEPKKGVWTKGKMDAK